MNFISPNTAAQYNIECKTEIQNIQVIQKKLDNVIQKIQAIHCCSLLQTGAVT